MGQRKVTGRLVFSDKVDGKEKPLHTMRVQLWDLDLKRNHPVAQGDTDWDGAYCLTYDPVAVGESWFQRPDLVVRVMDRDYHYTDDDQPEDEWELVAAFHRSSSEPPPGDEVDMGTRACSYWEYEDPKRPGAVAYSPRVEVLEGRTPQPFRMGRQLEQSSVIAPYAGIYKLGMYVNRVPTRPMIEPMNAKFPENLTRKMGAAKADSDDYFCEVVLNGFNPSLLRKGEQEGELYEEFSWKGLAQDGMHFAPDTRANFRLEDDELKLQSIVITRRSRGNDPNRYDPPETFTKEHPAWVGVKRLFRVNYFLFGEIVAHLSATHLNVEQYILALRRNVHKSPIARLLNPHFFGTVAVNLGANGLLIAPQGLIPKTSAVTPESVGEISSASFTTYNWKGWSPRQPLCSSHRYAHLGLLFWDMLGDYVDHVFEENDQEIRATWGEIHRMSQELVAHAAAYEPQDGGLYYDESEINTPCKSHPERKGRSPSAISAITTSDEACEEGISNLKQMCRYLIHLTTFQHTWVNDTQYDIGGEVRYATLGVTSDLSDPEELAGPLEQQVLPYDALQHPFYTYMLTKTRYGYILRNEDDDMPLALRSRLAARQAEFLKHGLDVRHIRSRINT